MIEPSGQPAQTPGETVPMTPHVPTDNNISSTLPTATESLMAPTPPPDTAITGETSQAVSALAVSIPENLVATLPDTSQNLLLPNTVPSKTGKLQHILMPITILCIIVVGISSIAYAYVNKIGPFGSSKYTEENFSSSMLGKISAIKSASYTFSAALDVVPRDVDATPFDIKVLNEKELKEAYYSDKLKLETIKNIISSLNLSVGYSGAGFGNSHSPEINIKTKTYANNLSEFDLPTYSDPNTDNAFEYQATENGNNFNLIATFVTDDAVKVAKGFDSSSTSTKAEGKKVTFTKDSYFLGYLDEEPPKPFLTQMSDSMSKIPPDVKGKMAITASSEFKPQSLADWSFNFDAEGDVSDMTYKINADVLRKADNYYFKINNFPGLALFSMAAPLKDKWVVIPSNPDTESTPSAPEEDRAPGGIQDSLKTGEESYKKNRDMIIGVIKKVALVADREKVLIFKSVPRSETIDGKKLTRYELSVKKNNLQAFYTALIAEIQKDPELMAKINANRELTTDEQKEASRLKEETTKKEIEDYLKSEEFNQIFDYIEKNNSFIVWTDADGFPVIIQNTMRIVPSDTAEKLKDKQITLVYALAISNINVPIALTAPTDAVTWDTISKELNPYQGRIEETKIIAGLSTINTIALGLYTKEQSYGKKGFGLGPCKPTVDTFFANEDVVKVLNELTNNDISLATCASRGKQGKIGLWAISVPLPNEPGFSYCIDKNTSKKITGNLKGLACK